MAAQHPASPARLFEQLVARIEEAASPRGAVVKSPDRIRDLTTGRLREVDASIRYKIGTASILITVECRKRSRRANDTWIEQLATKRAKIGAAKTIAVSARGFSSSAEKTAVHHGIELRTLSEVSAADIEGWFLPSGVVNVFRVFDELEAWVAFFNSEDRMEDQGFPIDPFSPVFTREGIDSPVPAAALLELFLIDHPDQLVEAPLDGTKKKYTFAVEYEHGLLQAATSDGRRDVSIVVFSLLVGYESRVSSLESGTHHIYSGGDGTAVQRSIFQAEFFGKKAEFEFQSTDDGPPLASYRFVPQLDEEK